MRGDGQRFIWIGRVHVRALDPASLEGGLGTHGGHLQVAAFATDAGGFAEAAAFCLRENGYDVIAYEFAEPLAKYLQTSHFDPHELDDLRADIGWDDEPGEFDVWFGTLHAFEYADA